MIDYSVYSIEVSDVQDDHNFEKIFFDLISPQVAVCVLMQISCCESLRIQMSYAKCD